MIEHSYKPNLMHSNLSFPLLKKLNQGGDKKARAVFKEKIVKGFYNGDRSVHEFLIYEGYTNFLKIEWNPFLDFGLTQNN
ncbi:MAG: hypothetical protein ACFFA0_01140 [Promethearchaeota archaeon]